EIARAEVPPGRLLGDPRVVLLRDLGLDVPVEAVALAGHHVHGLVGHVPVLRAFAARRDLLLVHVDAICAHVGLLGGRDDADPPVAGVLPPRVALPDDLLLLGRARRQHRRGPGLVGVARVAGAGVVDDGAGTAHAVRGALAAAELAEAVGLGGEPAKEDPTLALSHRKTYASRVSSVKGITIRR